MGLCSCTGKLILFVFNLICALIGLAILSVSIYAYFSSHSFHDLLAARISASIIILITVGAVTFFIAFLGCCGAVREDPCYISTYAVCLSIVLVIQLVIGALCIYFKSDITTELNAALYAAFQGYSTNSDYKSTIDSIQQTVECCGYDGPQYWYAISSTLPSSCCSGSPTSCTSPYTAGCAASIASVLKSSLTTIGWTAVALAAIELFCVVCAFCVASSIRSDLRKNYSY